MFSPSSIRCSVLHFVPVANFLFFIRLFVLLILSASIDDTIEHFLVASGNRSTLEFTSLCSNLVLRSENASLQVQLSKIRKHARVRIESANLFKFARMPTKGDFFAIKTEIFLEREDHQRFAICLVQRVTSGEDFT